MGASVFSRNYGAVDCRGIKIPHIFSAPHRFYFVSVAFFHVYNFFLEFFSKYPEILLLFFLPWKEKKLLTINHNSWNKRNFSQVFCSYRQEKEHENNIKTLALLVSFFFWKVPTRSKFPVKIKRIKYLYIIIKTTKQVRDQQLKQVDTFIKVKLQTQFQQYWI